MRWSRLLAPALVLAATTASAGEPRTVVLLPLDAPAGADSRTIGEATRDLIAVGLATAGATLVERDRLDAVLHEQRLAGALGPADSVRVGELLQATHALGGTLARTEKGWRLTLRALRVPDGAVLGTADVEGGAADLAATAQRAAREAAAWFGTPAPPSPLREDPRAAASLHYLRALGLHRAGLWVEAIGEFLEARRRSVRFPETRYWMGEAYLAAGRHVHAAIAFEGYLRDAPDGDLAGDARERLSRVREAGSSPAPRTPAPPSLAEAYLSEMPTEARAAAFERAISRGPQGIADLEAAAELPVEADEVVRIVLALADCAPDRFVDLMVRRPELMLPEVWPVFRKVFDASKARRVARALLSPHPVVRDPVVAFLREVPVELPSWGGEVPGAIREVFRQAAGSADADASLEGIRRLAREPETVALVAKRARDEAFDPSYRAQAVLHVVASVRSSADLCETILDWMDDDRAVLRRAARTIAKGDHSEYHGATPEERKRVDAVDARFAAKALEILLSRRWPEEALEWAWICNRTTGRIPAEPIEALLRSEHGPERAAGTELAWRALSDPMPWFWRGLEDEDLGVRGRASRGLIGSREPEKTIRDLLAWWRRRVDVPSGKEFGVHAAAGNALRGLAYRVRTQRPNPPVADAGPDAWEEWLSK